MALLLPVPAVSASAQRQSEQSRQMVGIADSLYGTSGFPAAAERYRAILAADPKDAVSAYLLGQALYYTGDWAGAARWDSVAAAISPRIEANALYQRTRALIKLGRNAEATASLRQAVMAGFLSTRLIASDSALDPLRSTPAFKAIAREIFGPHYGEHPAGAPSPTQIADGLRQMVGTIRARHPNPYRIWTPADWDRQLDAAVGRSSTMNEAEYLVTLMRLGSAVGDVHTSAFAGPESRLMQRAVPLSLWKFPEGLFIRATDSAHHELLGAQVLEVGMSPIRELWPKLIREFPFENEWMASGEMSYFLSFPDVVRGLGLSPDSNAIRFRLRMPDGAERVITVLAVQRSRTFDPSSLRGFTVPRGFIEEGPSDRPLWLKNRNANYTIASLPAQHALYFQFNVPRDDPAHPWADFLDTLVTTIKRDSVQRLVIDLRHNPGGWGYMAYDLSWRLREVPQVTQPGHLFVLLSRVTQSAGVVIAAELEQNANAVFVGEPVAAHPNLFNGPQGNHVPQVLPGTGLVFRVSDVVEQHSNALDRRRFIAPDIDAPLTWEAFVHGRDPSLGAALHTPFEAAAGLLDDTGGRPLPPYFRWQRPSQYRAWGSAEGHPIP